MAVLSALLIKAPLLPTPTPFSVIGLYKVKPLRSKVAPLLNTFEATVIFVPKAPLVIALTLPVELTPNFKVPALIVVPPEYVLAPDRVVLPEVFWTKAKAEVLIPSAITPVVKVVALVPVKVSVTGVSARAVPVILPVKVTPPESLLLIVLLASTLIARLLLNAVVVPVMLNMPPLKTMPPPPK